MNLTPRKRDEKGRYLSNYAPEKKRKAIMRFRRTADGKNLIVSLEGFLTTEEIREINPEVGRIWENSPHKMYWWGENSCYLTTGRITVKGGQVFNDENFAPIIAEMKACGAELSRIIRAVRAAEANEIRVIEI